MNAEHAAAAALNVLDTLGIIAGRHMSERAIFGFRHFRARQAPAAFGATFDRRGDDAFAPWVPRRRMARRPRMLVCGTPTRLGGPDPYRDPRPLLGVDLAAGRDEHIVLDPKVRANGGAA